ncbi:DNA-binding transcriptional LysR family regulator [Salibacterium salarium]|uniref:LysR family transcriptional regulator n=1 Tax=Salibacterium salarium TaxID=284579 RepID=UPI002784407F|nr:LysR family transcriptional regulator [Salibacterium salarium]MDQ0300299.1 DNA-binding transcriptional LysR family regulator [Salibacterium salarium]
MSIHHYTVFHAVIESGSFTKAAQKLALSQPAVSHSVRALEKELGIQLLKRNGKVELTEIGEALIPHINEIVSKQEHITQVIDEVQNIKKGTIRIGSFPSITSTVLAPLLGSFRIQYPGITFSIYDGGYEEVQQWLSTNSIDLGFLPYENKKFNTQLFYQDEYVAILPSNFQTNKEDILSIEELDQQSFILPLDGCEKVILPLFKEYNVSPNIEYELKNSLSIMGLVSEGLGISLIPKETAEIVTQTRVMSFRPLVSRNIYIGIKKGNAITPAIKEFLKFVEVR